LTSATPVPDVWLQRDADGVLSGFAAGVRANSYDGVGRGGFFPNKPP
jgi:hypothetical protein